MLNVSHGSVPTASNKEVSSGRSTSLNSLWVPFFTTGRGQTNNNCVLVTAMEMSPRCLLIQAVFFFKCTQVPAFPRQRFFLLLKRANHPGAGN